MSEYVVYDTKDNDCLVFMGTLTETAKYFRTTREIICSNVSRKALRERRYRIERYEY